ncbi:MAG: DUF1643 domain-containing protein, partial [Dehalococcoidia bacterium]|nr:DUF1643 domain-containing protein [Dehalococcoidia bacterium]
RPPTSTRLTSSPASYVYNTLVAAWGVLGAIEGRDARMMEFLRGSGVRIVYCLALNAGGSPRHPMYLPGDVEPVVYRGFGPVRPECGVSADTPMA